MSDFTPTALETENPTSPETSCPIEVERLKVGYGDRTILTDVTFFVNHGQITTILGGSGCGKSTLLKVLIGLLKPTSGRVKLLGKELPEDGWDLEMRLKFGVLFQGAALFNSLTLLENVALPLVELRGWDDEAAREVARLKLELVGLSRAAHQLPSELSGGMKKRAGLARALVLDPPLLFCDEPSAGLDPITSAELDDLLISLKQQLGTTIIVVTHELASIRRISDLVVMLGGGGILIRGPLEDVMHSKEPAVRNFFSRNGQDKLWEDSYHPKKTSEITFIPTTSHQMTPPKPASQKPETTSDDLLKHPPMTPEEFDRLGKQETLELPKDKPAKEKHKLQSLDDLEEGGG